jgi:hypothetical protein
MAIWDLSAIEKKVRLVTGRFTENEMTTTELRNRINQYYQYTFPAEVKVDREHTFYEFLTTPNQPTYAAPTGFTNFEPPATINQYSLLWYQEPMLFYAENWKQISMLTPWTGDGVTTSFNTTITGFPIWPATTVITDNTEVFEDNNETFANSPVTITGSLNGSATVNYSTGAVTVNFNTAPTNGQLIYLSYALFAPTRPQAVLYYNNEFSFWPIPDTAYKFQVKAYAVPTELINATDRPPLDQWGPCIAYGTSRGIFADYGELEAYAETSRLYKEQVAYVLNRTDQNLLNTRALPHF